jgi:hypothetical protein
MMITCRRETLNNRQSYFGKVASINAHLYAGRAACLLMSALPLVLVLLQVSMTFAFVVGFQNTNDNGCWARIKSTDSSRATSSIQFNNRKYQFDDKFGILSRRQYMTSMSLHASMKKDDDINSNQSNKDTNSNFKIFDSLQQFFMGNPSQLFGSAAKPPLSNIPTETTICTIPAQHVKKGGLRLFLMFYLMGMQNTPDKNTWRVYEMQSSPNLGFESKQSSTTPNDEPLGIEYFFYDNSAVLTIILESNMVRIIRRLPTNGSIISQPSNTYIMQESIIVDGILNELDQCAHDDTVPSTNRLLLLKDTDQNAITEAKDMLSFG